MIEYKGGKEYWNGRKCDSNFVFRTLADMFPQDYELYIKESKEYKKKNIVLHCSNCNYDWVNYETDISTAQCPTCKSMKFQKL
ncbi:hypothetical protein ACPOM7_21090 [Peribacillus castrilensis]|uniref:Uncharacterized protein n=1 Tax=Peribacillus simplex TaxID=1478 RepID=A0AAN2PI81_9BACI|nr:MULTISPECIES: hypothetical protein [Bacillaceae]MCF7620400.1 hypothetical protein [Peribacillus frigoritolerans]MCP1155953.1 hypothetical protein [Peribacillus frigoritolerans]MCT1391894.1 hypothetical protein [Peribacillus frigoritolerans]PAL04634.1 hypothetical protein B8W99_26615 [Peribacillus simplex]PRA73920.1 hypothetical protein CQ056_27475 [Peribacillus simplex]